MRAVPTRKQTSASGGLRPIVPPNIKTVEFKLVGVTPLVVSRFRETSKLYNTKKG